MTSFNGFKESMTTSRLKPLGLSSLAVALLLGSASSADAGAMHARSVIGLGVHSQTASHNGVAHAERHQGSKYRISHEELGNNYTYGNAGNGHAHHHSTPFMAPPNQGSSEGQILQEPPVLGSRGTSQYLRQTWRPNAAGNGFDVTWDPKNFLQVDPAELTLGGRLVSSGSLTAPGLTATVELSAQLDEKGNPKIETKLTGAFQGMRFALVTHPNGVVSLQFQQPLAWTFPGTDDTFDLAIEGTIDTGEEDGAAEKP